MGNISVVVLFDESLSEREGVVSVLDTLSAYRTFITGSENAELDGEAVNDRFCINDSETVCC